MDTRKLDPIAKRFNKVHQALFRKSKGRYGSRLMGVDLVMMTTAAQYGKPKEGLAAMDILANSVIAAVRDAR